MTNLYDTYGMTGTWTIFFFVLAVTLVCVWFFASHIDRSKEE